MLKHFLAGTARFNGLEAEMLREIKVELPNMHTLGESKCLVAVYPLLNGKLAVVLCDHPTSDVSVTNFNQYFAMEALRQIPELKGKHPVSDIVWFETFWVSTLSALAGGERFYFSASPPAHFAGKTPVGRRVSRLEWRTLQRQNGSYPWKIDNPVWEHEATEGDFLLPMIEGSAIQCGWPVPALTSMELKDAFAF